MTVDIFVNPATGATPAETPSREPLEYHRRLPGYRPTPLVDAPSLAERLGVARVGSLAAATVRHYRRPGPAERPRLIGVEPATAACVLASLRAGRLTTVPGPHESIMAGLNCGSPSYVAWPYLSAGIDSAVAIDDDRARDAMRRLAAIGVVSGESGAAALAGAIALTDAGSALDPSSSVLVLSTEGATDEESYHRIVGAP